MWTPLLSLCNRRCYSYKIVHGDRSDKEFRSSIARPLTLFTHTTFADHISMAQRKQREQRSGTMLQTFKAHPSYILPPVNFHILRVQLPPQCCRLGPRKGAYGRHCSLTPWHPLKSIVHSRAFTLSWIVRRLWLMGNTIHFCFGKTTAGVMGD